MSWSKTIVSLRSESPPAFGFVPWEVLNTIAGHESMRMIRKGQIRSLAKGDVSGRSGSSTRFTASPYDVPAGLASAPPLPFAICNTAIKAGHSFCKSELRTRVMFSCSEPTI
jgi:hypothetical protein